MRNLITLGDMEKNMHPIEFGIFCLATILEKEQGESELSRAAKELASESHFYCEPNSEMEFPNLDEVIEFLKSRAGIP